MICLKSSGKGVLVTVHAQPRASRSALVGLHGDALKIAVQAPPVDSAANEAIRDLLAEIFSLPSRAVELRAGATGRRKSFFLEGVSMEHARNVLEEELA